MSCLRWHGLRYSAARAFHVEPHGQASTPAHASRFRLIDLLEENQHETSSEPLCLFASVSLPPPPSDIMPRRRRTIARAAAIDISRAAALHSPQRPAVRLFLQQQG